MSAPLSEKSHPEPAVSGNRSNGGLVGAKLRALRKRRGMTLQAVSCAAGVSVGHLSQLERDITSPAVKTLHDISVALGVGISWFFEEAEDESVDSKYVVRQSERRRIHFADGIDDYQLNSRSVTQLGLLYCVFEPGASSGREAYTHAGEEAGYVVSGTLDLWIDEEQTTLRPGDSFSFPSECRHRYANPGTEPAVVIWAMTPPSY